jgi:hypothetical protein
MTATVKSGVGRGGNITIDPQFVILERSQIRADAFGGLEGTFVSCRMCFWPIPPVW